MPKRLAAAVSLLGALVACSGGEPVTPLTVNPYEVQTVAGPTVFTATPPNLAVTWTLTGPGSLSGTTGRQVTYRPPSPVDPAQKATVTATSGAQTSSVTFSLAAPPVAPGVIPGLHAAVQVLNDAQEVPHIFCGNALDCFAVQGYLQARDRLFQMDLFRRTARGQLASMIGALEVGSDKQFLTLFTTRDGKRIEDLLVAALDTDTSAKLTAFASGVNAYLAYLTAHPVLMPGEYSQLPFAMTPADIPPWTLQDTLAIGRLQQFQLSESLSKDTDYGLFALTYGPGAPHQDLGKYATYIRPKQPIAGYTLSTTDNTKAPPPQANAQVAFKLASAPDLSAWQAGLAAVGESMEQMRTVFGSLRLGAGSNNWVVDAAHSATGKAMVANDPHLALQYPPLFHLSALTASDSSGLNLAGGAFPGIPGALIGRGAHVGWGVTVVGYDVTDLYLEKLVCGGPPALPCPAVMFNGAPVPLTVAVFPLQVRTAAGLTTQQVPVLVVPHHGPVIRYDPATQTAITMRWTGHEVTNDLRAFLNLNNASAVGDTTAAAGTAFGALKDYAIGAQNFVLADDQGNIGYDPHALVPKRPWAGSVVNGRPLLPWLPLPGDGSAEWGSGVAGDNCAGALPAAACWIPDDQLPRGVNPTKGYFATANSDPGGYGDTFDPNTGLPTGVAGAPYLSFDWSDPTDVRYARIAQLLKAKTTSGGKMSVDDMKAVQTDHQLLLAKLLLPFLPASSSVPTAQQPAYLAALSLFTQWGADGYDCPTGLTSADPKSAVDPDPTRSRDSAACLLFHTFLRQLVQTVFDDDMALVGKTTGSSFSGDVGAELRGLFFMLNLPANHPAASFCNDVDKTGTVVATHSCGDQLVAALVGALATLQRTYGPSATNWVWGRVHTLTTTSAAAPLVANGFAAGPYARPGGALTVDVASPDGASGPTGFSYSHGSNVRFIAAMADATTSVTKMQLPGPQRDGPHGVFSNSADLLGQYVLNQYFDYALGHQIDAAAVSAEGFTAQ